MTQRKAHRGKNEAEARTAGFASFVSRLPRRAWIAAGCVAALGIVVLLVAVLRTDTAPPAAETVVAEETLAVAYRHPLTGEALDAPLGELPQVFGVMVENASDAWPLAGIDEAFLVIEAPVEGNIPRFIAFFSEEQEVGKIGPVRSARPYYLDWNDELDAVYAHVGGSPEALDLIKYYGTVDLNEFFQGEYFYRSSYRYAPHNAYTTSEDLVRALDELQLDAPAYTSWTFKDAPVPLENTSEISFAIDWSTGTTYDVRWEYGLLTGTYQRRQGGAHGFTDLAESGESIADNVVVMEADIEVVDGVGRRHIATVGEGRAYVAQDGALIVATWKKPSRTDRLRFYDEAGAEIAMNAGTTWIEVVPSLGQVVRDRGDGTTDE